MYQSGFTAALAVAILLLSTSPASAQLDCPVVAAGGNSTGDGSILVVGQVIAGDAGPADELAQGAVPCWDSGVSAGDPNCDGIVNAGDIDAFVLAITDPAGYSAQFPDCDRNLADLNCDGLINAGDIDGFVDCLVLGECGCA